MGNTQVNQKFKSLSEPINVDKGENKFWTLYDGVLQTGDDANVSVFENKTNFPEESKTQAIAACVNALKQVKSLRHPFVIKYVDSLLLKEDQSHYYLATEPVVPLRSILHGLEFSEILLGLHQIASALAWLHSSLGIIHNNVHLDSIYVSKHKQSKWVLGDFHFAVPFKELNEEFIKQTRELRYNETLTPEEGLREFKKFKMHTRDAWGFGKFVSKIFGEVGEMQKKANIVPAFDYKKKFMSDPSIKAWLQSALDSDPENRQPMEGFLACKIFETDGFVNTMLFFDDMRARKSAEKERFFRSLYAELKQLPLPLVKKRLVPRMLTLPFITEPSANHFLMYLFSSSDSEQKGERRAGLLPREDFEHYIAPFLKKCFASSNRSLRTRVLQYLEYFIWEFAPDYVITTVTDEVLSSLRDNSNDLVMFAMNGLVLLARYFMRLDAQKNTEVGISLTNNKIVRKLHHFSCAEPNIAVRSHALLCLMELWSLPKVNKNVILSALHYALYDPDSYEVKLYALNVILMHLRKYDPRELVSVIMKFVLPLTLHERHEVRTKASQVLKACLDFIAEVDVTECNLGKVSRNDKPHAAVAKLQPVFPPESSAIIQRASIFQGAGPRVTITLPTMSDVPPELAVVPPATTVSPISTAPAIAKHHSAPVEIPHTHISSPTTTSPETPASPPRPHTEATLGAFAKHNLKKIPEVISETTTPIEPAQPAQNENEEEEEAWEEWEDKEEESSKTTSKISKATEAQPTGELKKAIGKPSSINVGFTGETADEDPKSKEADYFAEVGMDNTEALLKVQREMKKKTAPAVTTAPVAPSKPMSPPPEDEPSSIAQLILGDPQADTNEEIGSAWGEAVEIEPEGTTTSETTVPTTVEEAEAPQPETTTKEKKKKKKKRNKKE